MSSTPPALSDITLAILAGGEGSRMGIAKGLLRIGKQPILEYLLDRLRWPGPTTLITAPGREHPPGWRRFDQEWVDPAGGMGPLRGVLTALEHSRTQLIAVATVDMPAIRSELIAELAQSMGAADLGAMFGRQSKTREKIVEPFPLIICTEAVGIVRERIERGALSVVKLLEEKSFRLKDASDQWTDDLWLNLNRPEDLKMFQGVVIPSPGTPGEG